MRITHASTPAALDDARALVRRYFMSWGMTDVDDPDLLDELATLSGRYGLPDGDLLVAYLDDEPAGVVGLKRQDARSCVMKRMFVLPRFRGRGVGRCLAIELLLTAERLGYERMVLDTPADNDPAVALYRSLGFAPTAPYAEHDHDHTHEGWSFWDIALPPDDGTWFRWTTQLLETAYLATENVFMQSGNSAGTAERWELTRGIVAEPIERDGTFLDVGCANGLLMESVARWCDERGLTVEPYGLDISARLAALARARLPRWADRIFVGNAWTWQPPLRFDVVSTRIEYVPRRLRPAFPGRLLDTMVAPGGRLVVIGLSGKPGDGHASAEDLRAWGYRVDGEAERLAPDGTVAMRAAWLDRG